MHLFKDKQILLDEEEIMLIFNFHSKNISFDYLRWSMEDDDYVLYLKFFNETKKIYYINRVWLKTIFSELRDKKLIFNDMQENESSLRLWFYF